MRRFVTTSLVVLACLGCDDVYHVDCKAGCEHAVACQGNAGDLAACTEKCEALDGILDEGARKALDACIDGV